MHNINQFISFSVLHLFSFVFECVHLFLSFYKTTIYPDIYICLHVFGLYSVVYCVVIVYYQVVNIMACTHLYQLPKGEDTSVINELIIYHFYLYFPEISIYSTGGSSINIKISIKRCKKCRI